MSTVLDDPDRLDLTGTIQISRSDPERWVRRARISISMGELEQAREDLHIALQLDPDCLEARLELLRVDAQLDRLQEELYDQDPWMAVSVHGPGQGLTGRRRAFFEANVATTCPTIAAVEAIASWVGRQTVLEVGAGRGLWSRLLADRGVEMLTTESPRRLDDLSTWTHVLALEPERAVTALSAEVLLVDAHSGVLPDVLARFRGRAAVVLSTGSTALEEGLAASWSCVQTVRLPSFGERPERLRFFVRRAPMTANGALFGRLTDADDERVELLRSVIDCMPSGVVVVDMDGDLVLYNAAARNALASRFVPLEVCWPDREVFDIEGTRRLEPSELPLARALQGEICDDVELTVRTKANKTAMLRVNARPMLQIARGTLWAVAVFQDIGEEIDAARHQRELERQLAQAQKMESLGQLASGIAHEINTPTQYISDNVRFLSDAFEAMARYQGEVAAVVADGAVEAEAAERLDGAREDAELEFYAEEVPAAIRQSLEGLDRVASIVRAMKEYAHPCDTKEPTDLDHVVKTTVAMSKNEYKYVADLELELAGDLPKVACVAGEISQVLLNLVVNAAHAIAEAGRERGVIRIRTSAVDDGVQLEVTDNGVGVPEHLSERIFDPFFTTKAVGKGTGQGLALAFDVVVRKHGGRLDVRSTQGEGSTFTVFVPRNAREAPAA